MILFKQAKALSHYLTLQQQAGKRIGFVPTMGALHDGHLSLLNRAKLDTEVTVCSIFVNPTQFNNPDDFAKYPVTIEPDIAALTANGCDVLFLPDPGEVYHDRHETKHYNIGNLETILEGKYRPGHFQGVCQVVDRLLEIVHPDKLYLGQKDHQQCQVIQKLLTLTGRQHIALVTGATVRDNDGLALSSRNLRLNAAQRSVATALYKMLDKAKQDYGSKPVDQITSEAINILTRKGFKVDYFEIADAETLVLSTDLSKPKIALVAAYLDDIRLIDNLPLN